MDGWGILYFPTQVQMEFAKSTVGFEAACSQGILFLLLMEGLRGKRGACFSMQGPNSIEKTPTEKPTENPTEKPTEIPYTKKKSKYG